MSFLSKILRDYREKKNLRRSDVAQGIGYKNVNKGIRKIEEVENYTGCYNSGVRMELSRKIALFLNVPDRVFDWALDEDARLLANDYCRDYSSLFSDSFMLVRFAPAWYVKKEVLGKTDIEREEYVKVYAKEHSLYVCLVLKNGNCIYIDKKGEAYSIVEHGTCDKIIHPICYEE